MDKDKSVDGVKLDNVFKQANGYGPRVDKAAEASKLDNAPAAKPQAKVVDDVLAADDDIPAVAKVSETVEIKTDEPKPKAGKPIKIALMTLVVLLLAGLATWGVYSWIEIQSLRDPANIQQQVEEQAKAETQILVDKVGKLMELPDGDPVIATVTDKDKLVDQPFFAKAENGDKVLIFSESSVAVIYRESDNKIINSGPIAITTDETTAETEQSDSTN
jgi:hypothetical protein